MIEGRAGKIREGITELLYPRRCPVCDGIPGWNKGLICPECEKGLHFVEEPLCRKCGKRLERAEREYCYDCSHTIHWYEEGAALFEYQEIRESIYRFKYMGRQEYASYYAKAAADRLGGKIERWHAQAFVPIPIHRERRKKRGYNQTELFARELSAITGIPVMEKFLVRCRNTVAQKGLDDRERQNNLKKAFKILENDVKLDTLIVIDDIYTTGSTIDAVSRVCKAAGVKKVYFIALAIGEGL